MRPIIANINASSVGTIPIPAFQFQVAMPSVYPMHLIKNINIDECKCAIKSNIPSEQIHALNMLLTIK